MKIYRSAREVLEAIGAVLAGNSGSAVRRSPLDEVARLLQQGRHYGATAIYVRRGQRLALLGCSEQRRLQFAASLSAQEFPLASPLGPFGQGFAQSIRTPGSMLGIIFIAGVDSHSLGREDRILLKQVATKLALFLAGRGKYLLHQVHSDEAACAVETKHSTNSVRESAHRAAVATGKRANS